MADYKGMSRPEQLNPSQQPEGEHPVMQLWTVIHSALEKKDYNFAGRLIDEIPTATKDADFLLAAMALRAEPQESRRKYVNALLEALREQYSGEEAAAVYIDRIETTMLRLLGIPPEHPWNPKNT